MNRQQRRHLEAQQRKQGIVPSKKATSLYEVANDIKNINSQMVKLLEFNKTLYNSIHLMRTTLERLGVMTLEDMQETQNLYKKQKDLKLDKIKEILSSDMTEFEKIDFCFKDLTGKKPGYERFNLSPVKDLNVAPPIINEWLTEQGYSGTVYKQYATALGVPETMMLKEQ